MCRSPHLPHRQAAARPSSRPTQGLVRNDHDSAQRPSPSSSSPPAAASAPAPMADASPSSTARWRQAGAEPHASRHSWSMPGSPGCCRSIHPDHADRYAALGLDRPAPAAAGHRRRDAAGLGAGGAEGAGAAAARPGADPGCGAAACRRRRSSMAVIAALRSNDAALPVVPVTDTIKRSLDGQHGDGHRGSPDAVCRADAAGLSLSADSLGPYAGRAGCRGSSPTMPRSPNGPG